MLRIAAFIGMIFLSACAAQVKADIIYGLSTGTGIIAADTNNMNAPSTVVYSDTTNSSHGLAFGPNGNLYSVINDTGDSFSHIEAFTRSGTGAGTLTDAGVYRAGVSSYFFSGLAFDSVGNAYVSTGSGVTVYKVGGGTSTISGTGTSVPYQMAILANTLYLTDLGVGKVFKADLSQATPTLSTFATLGTGVSSGVATDQAGNVYVSTSANQTIKYDSNGNVVANPFASLGGNRSGLAFDNSDGNLYLVAAPALYQINSSGAATQFYPTGYAMPEVEFIAEASAATVPEPSAFLLTGLMLTALVIGYYRRRAFSSKVALS